MVLLLRFRVSLTLLGLDKLNDDVKGYVYRTDWSFPQRDDESRSLQFSLVTTQAVSVYSQIRSTGNSHTP